MASSGPGQNQLKRDDMLNQPSDIHSQPQNPNFIQETGTQIGNIAHGATEMGKGVFLGAASLTHGAVQGVSNVGQGTADAIKNTFGLGNTESAAPANSNSATLDNSGYPSRPSYPHAP